MSAVSDLGINSYVTVLPVRVLRHHEVFHLATHAALEYLDRRIVEAMIRIRLCGMRWAGCCQTRRWSNYFVAGETIFGGGNRQPITRQDSYDWLKEGVGLLTSRLKLTDSMARPNLQSGLVGLQTLQEILKIRSL